MVDMCEKPSATGGFATDDPNAPAEEDEKLTENTHEGANSRRGFIAGATAAGIAAILAPAFPRRRRIPHPIRSS
ncbi:twin-arginine translocation signal domain-containing protein [Nocardia sp. CA-119907]|uniref:twin-arginine translocation signal domain-containing protein n=1 Tax=Nocardia sp. CA-119907 TaxID=3239973 RepID=UPI003D973132